MISKWFIGVKAKSKGHFTGFHPKKSTPSFTQQTALATGYDTKEQALAGLKSRRYGTARDIADAETHLTVLLYAKKNWANLTLDEKIDLLVDNNILLGYIGQTFGGQPCKRTLYPRKNLAPDDQKIVEEATFDDKIIEARLMVDVHTTRLDFVDKHLLVREDTIEIKFSDSARKKIEWTIRDDNDTDRTYCNCCGGAVPSIPQLVIGHYYKDRIRICAICMINISNEAKIQAGKISDEIMQHHQTDRFLRNV